MFHYIPEKVCSREIHFDIIDGYVHNVKFIAGCPGNLKALAKLVEGMPVSEVISKLEGITCGERGTSCADQFTKALRQYK